jgi:elongation factor P--(R)-beta-lysine ligase
VAKAPWWRQDVFADRAANLRMRGAMLRATRQFFETRDFAEVETPALQVSPGLEPHLKAFATTLEDSGETRGRQKRRLFLHTSPEFAMKKLLAAGVKRMFQLAHVFRNAERSFTHHPEFSLLEWYRAGATYRDLMEDCEELLRHTLKAAGRTFFTYKGKSADPAQKFQRLSVAESFERFAGIDLLATAPDPQKPELKLLAKAAKPLGISPHRGDSWEDLFFRIFLDRIEPHLGSPVPTLLYDYPLSMAALARTKPGDPRLAERVELYVCGLELANGFSELTDAKEQRARFARDRSAKRRIYGTAYPVDEDFLAALEAGLPESAGMALGFDRLVMLASGAATIDEVLWAPVG